MNAPDPNPPANPLDTARWRDWTLLLASRRGPAAATDLAAPAAASLTVQPALVRDLEMSAAPGLNERRLNLVEHTAAVGCWTIDPSNGQLEHSVGCAVVLGLTSASPLGTLDELLHCFAPMARVQLRQQLERCTRHGTMIETQAQLLTPGSNPKWVRTLGHAVYDGAGQLLHIEGTVQDISAQKQAQDEAVRLANRLAATLASISEAFVTLDRQCCFAYANQESERLLQQTSADMLGRPLWHGMGPVLEQRLRLQLGRALRSKHRFELEDFFPSLGKWLELHAYPFAEGLTVYLRDVTERRRSQEQLLLLQTSVSRLNDIVVIAELCADNGPEPLIVFVNDAFERHTGYSRSEVLGQSPRMLLELDDRLQDLLSHLQQVDQARTELLLQRKKGGSFWIELEVMSVQASAEQARHWVAVARDITQRKNAEDMIRHMVLYDALTDLPNRQLLLDRLQKALTHCARSGQHGALMFIDLDHFKVINDTLGHHIGDHLLQHVAKRLTQSVRKTDTVARLGGDEFVVMADDLGLDRKTALQKAGALTEKVLNMLRDPFQLAGHQHFATPSIGVTVFDGLQREVGELLKQADLAMYQAKSQGRNAVCFFDPTMQATMSASAAIGADLRMGLRQQQFEVHYQPQVDRLGEVVGVEALLRWQHPQRGLVRPNDFIPVAEDTGLILPLGQWVVQTACEQLAAWAHNSSTAHLSISVNVSVHQFRHPDFVDLVLQAIEQTGIRAPQLKLELTESLLADRMEITIQKMGRLRALGVTLAIDDFGVGYSSLSCLKRLPLSQLKIDKGFVADVLSDPHDAAIARVIIELAQSLHLQVVAEGVETREQRDFLASQGCEYFQGHLFAPALPIKQLEAFLYSAPSRRLVQA